MTPFFISSNPFFIECNKFFLLLSVIYTGNDFNSILLIIIRSLVIADLTDTCLLRSDEPQNCTERACPENHFRCRSGRCILLTWKCDGDKDCPDGEDEPDTCSNPDIHSCQPTYFKCDNSKCIPGRCVPRNIDLDQTTSTVYRLVSRSISFVTANSTEQPSIGLTRSLAALEAENDRLNTLKTTSITDTRVDDVSFDLKINQFCNRK